MTCCMSDALTQWVGCAVGSQLKGDPVFQMYEGVSSAMQKEHWGPATLPGFGRPTSQASYAVTPLNSSIIFC